MSKELRIFSPTIMFNDFVSAAWHHNIKTVEGKLPVHGELRASGVYAVSIEPDKNAAEGWYAWGLPFRKDWLPYDAGQYKNPALSFEVVGESALTFTVEVASSTDARYKTEVGADHTEAFGTVDVDLSKCPFVDDLKLVVWSGSKDSGRYVVRNIKLVER